MNEYKTEISKKQAEKETALLRAYVRQLNASVEVYNIIKDQFKFSAQQWMVDEIMHKKKRVLASVQEVVLKRDDAVEDRIPWFSVITTNYFKFMSKLSFEQQAFIANKLYDIETKLSESLHDVKSNAHSEKALQLVDDIKKIEEDIFDGLSVLKKLNSPCRND